MRQRFSTTCVLAILAWIVLAPSPAEARYRYGSYRGATSDRGFYVELEGAFANPRNTDAVVATLESVEDFGGGLNAISPVVPDWSDDLAARLTLGYQWASGNKLRLSLWGYETDQESAGNGPAAGLLHFAIGPPIYTGGEYVGAFGSPGYFQMQTEISAQTADLAWAREQELGESFSMEWSLGLRYASFEETMTGLYDDANTVSPDFGLIRYAAEKSNEGEMFGARVAARGNYRVTERFFVSSSLGFSMLDGELTGWSSLTPTGLDNAPFEPQGFAALEDTGRSGRIVDFDVRGGWNGAGGRFQIWLGWEQAQWEGIAEDLMRNLPGTTAPLRERTSVVISGYKLGARFRF